MNGWQREAVLFLKCFFPLLAVGLIFVGALWLHERMCLKED